MIIGVDVRPVSYPQLTGIGVYLNNLLQAIQELDQENHYYFISNRAIHFEVVNPRWEKIPLCGNPRRIEVALCWRACRLFDKMLASSLVLIGTEIKA
jgi:hypothetical protein